MSAETRWWHRLTGGRPMVREDHAGFFDHIGREMVYRWRDGFGRRWLATGSWSWFRVRATFDSCTQHSNYSHGDQNG